MSLLSRIGFAALTAASTAVTSGALSYGAVYSNASNLLIKRHKSFFLVGTIGVAAALYGFNKEMTKNNSAVSYRGLQGPNLVISSGMRSYDRVDTLCKGVLYGTLLFASSYLLSAQINHNITFNTIASGVISTSITWMYACNEAVLKPCRQTIIIG